MRFVLYLSGLFLSLLIGATSSFLPIPLYWQYIVYELLLFATFYNWYTRILSPDDIQPIKRDRVNWKYAQVVIWLFLANILISLTLPKPAHQQVVLANIQTFPNFFRWLLPCLLAPYIEEFIFRKALYTIFVGKRTTFILVSTLLFGVFHIQPGPNLYTMVYPIMQTFLIGFTCSKVYDETKSLHTTFMIHSLYNTLVLILAIMLF